MKHTKKYAKHRGPLHVRPDEEPDVTFVLMRDNAPDDQFCGYCGHTDHPYKACPVRESVGAIRFG